LGYHVIQYYQSLIKKEVEIERIKSLQRAAELANLKTQLNPHFLFNALNSIRALTLSEPYRAREMLTMLADLLRSSLNLNNDNLIKLADEMSMVNDYIALEKMRFEERLQVSIQIPVALMDFYIPTFSVQLLVENAIKHGLAKREELTHIAISIREVDEQIHIVVSNSGIYYPNTKGGTGLNNLKQRLAMIYSGHATFSIEQDAENKVIAKIIIPIVYD
jgi:two-component system, LytTR family, sensor kinase